MCSEEDKEKLDELFEKYKPYMSKPGEGGPGQEGERKEEVTSSGFPLDAIHGIVAETCRKRPSPKTV